MMSEVEGATKVESTELTADKLRDLIALRERGSNGNWELKHGLMSGSSIGITTYFRKDDKKLGSIATVHTENSVGETVHGEYRSRKHSIPTGRDDADLICQAVNWLKPMAEAILNGSEALNTGWVIEFGADRHGPVRWYAAGYDLPVIDIKDATWFCREQDADATKNSQKLPWSSTRQYRRDAIPAEVEE